ncbi:DUF805 domain-containing protein [Candidatus Magnetominusculus xianensis]|uniref:Membrane protein n=1 Tax=Candidatus Magnetominusculus xianensis TaxID=1748249 RepID=A0ABR5SLD5_9BACT|nr:DUF805 domain-containing protein [Candidatus Magnetominusculus xianensis]KWT94496.1 membrane protein [Candidatus Magnetominusculus xianensis]MBF0405110.1 DUF805 domain-containing protein [Nitrospirota bacterium]
MLWYITVLKKYAVFSGRARRKEYWMYILYNFIFSIVAGVVDGVLGIDAVHMIYTLAVVVPSIAAGIRRMHDVDKSGWFLLIPLYNLYLAVTEGTRGDNKYGPDPKASVEFTS